MGGGISIMLHIYVPVKLFFRRAFGGCMGMPPGADSWRIPARGASPMKQDQTRQEQ
jgi:hypothetical protein